MGLVVGTHAHALLFSQERKMHSFREMDRSLRERGIYDMEIISCVWRCKGGVFVLHVCGGRKGKTTPPPPPPGDAIHRGLIMAEISRGRSLGQCIMIGITMLREP